MVFVTTTNFHWCLGGIWFFLLSSQVAEHQLQPFQSLSFVKMSFMLPPESWYFLHLHAFFWRVRAAQLGGKRHITLAQQGDDRAGRVGFGKLFLCLILPGDLSLFSLQHRQWHRCEFRFHLFISVPMIFARLSVVADYRYCDCRVAVRINHYLGRKLGFPYSSKQSSTEGWVYTNHVPLLACWCSFWFGSLQQW